MKILLLQTFYWILFILILVSSCKNKESTQTLDSVKTIDLTRAINDDIKLNLSDFIDTLYYIRPEVVNDKPIGSYNNVVFKNDTLVLIDSHQNIFIYNSDGKYISSFNKNGRGPGEYLRITNFDLYHGKIYILNDIYNILVYDLQGNLLSNTKTSHLPLFIKESYDKIFTYTVPPFIASNGFFRFSVYDIDMKELDTFNNTYYKEMESNIKSFGYTDFYSFRDTLSFWEPIRDTIFRVTKDYRIIPKYFLSLGKNAMPFDLSLKRTDENIEFQYTTIGQVCETENLFLIGCTKAPEMHYKTILVSKSNLSGGNVIFNLDIIDNGFHNDFDGGYPFWPKLQINEKLMISWFNPIAFRKKFSNDYFKTIKPKHKILADKFREEINSQTANPNDWIMLVKFK